MATWQTIIERTTGQVDTTDLLDYDEIIAKAVNDVVDKCNDDLLYSYSKEPSDIPAEGLSVSIKRTIAVYRNGKVCHKKHYSDYSSFSDSSSIHGASSFTPVYYIQNLGDPDTVGDTSGPNVLTFPLPTSSEKAQYWGFTYQTIISSTSETSTVASLGVPEKVIQWIALVASERILAYKINLMIHDEEDAELTAMIQGQIAYVRDLIQVEESKYASEDMKHTETKGGSL